MKRLLTLIIIMILAASSGLRAQLDPVSLALRAYQNQDLPKAKELIDLAMNDANYNSLSKTWYFGGYIYKELYKSDKKSAQGHTFRDKSITCFQKTIELDAANEFKEDCLASLKFLASTLYNDAAMALDTNNFDVSQGYYDRYKSLVRTTNPEIDFSGRDIEYKLYKASKYSLMFDNPENKLSVEDLSTKIIELYDQVLVIDSNNISANYNLAIHYYNQGVNIIENMDYEAPFEELFMLQEKVTSFFQKALPYMLKAYKLDPKRKATLQGLSGIYFGLSDIEKSQQYQKELDDLGEQGK